LVVIILRELFVRRKELVSKIEILLIN